MKDLGRIRRLFYRDGESLSEISRKTGFSRNTVKHWLKTPEGTEPKYRRLNPNTKVAPYAAQLIKALETDARRPKRDRRSALKLFGELQAGGFTGNYCRVTEFIRRWRTDGGTAVSKAYVPLHFELGEAFQFDWSEEHLIIGGVWRKILASHLKLCASRAFVVQAYPTQGHEMLFAAHTSAFAALGGIPRRGIYDNMKTAVDKVKKGKARIVNSRFAAMASHYLFDPDFCNVASGWEKGVVEKNVQDSRQRIWQDAGKERFRSFDELNAWLLVRCRTLWQELRHPEYGELSVAEMLEHEQPSLMPMVASRRWRPRRSNMSRRWARYPALVWCRWIATATRFPASWSGKWSACGCTRRKSTSSPTMPWSPAIHAVSRDSRRSMTGNTTFRWSKESRAP